MAFTQPQLRKAIKDILKDADLDNLSAKKVRLSLEEKYSADLSDRKKEIDKLVMEIIEENQEEDEQSSEEEIEEPEPPKKKLKPTPSAPKPKPKPAPKKTKEEVKPSESSDDDDVNDEDLAKKLNDELNSTGRPTRSTRHTPKKKKERKTKEKGERKSGTSAYSKPCLLSHELAQVMGADMLARNEIVKKMWQIVKERNLQDPSNRQFMICDEQLLPIFGKKKVKTFGMMKYLKNHIKDAKDVAS